MFTRYLAFLLFSYLTCTCSIFGQTGCDGTDTTLPVIIASPQIGDGSCTYPQPDFSATDNSETQLLLQTNTVAEVNYNCQLFQPDIEANLCLYAYEAALILFGLPNEYKYYTLDSGTFNALPDGTATIAAEFSSVNHPNGHFALMLSLEQGKTWEEWGALFKADCGGIAANHVDWMYYLITSGSTLVGSGDFEGTTLTLMHYPANHQFGYQVGLGANSYSSEYGSGGWFTTSGNFYDSGELIAQLNSNGDFMFRHECINQLDLSYVYTATDNCGNTSMYTQDILECEDSGPMLLNMPLAGRTMTACEFSNWQPEWVSACSGEIASSKNYEMLESDSEGHYILQVFATATDSCAISRTFSFQVEIIVDPLSNCPITGCMGDFDGDQFVGTSDLSLLIGSFGSDDFIYDLNLDGNVNLPDMLLWFQSFGSLCD